MDKKITEQLARLEDLLTANKTIMTLREVAQYTGLSMSYLYKLTCYRQIPHFKPHGKKVYFEKEAIDNWLRQGKVSSSEELEQQAATYLVTKRKRR